MGATDQKRSVLEKKEIEKTVTFLRRFYKNQAQIRLLQNVLKILQIPKN